MITAAREKIIKVEEFLCTQKCATHIFLIGSLRQSSCHWNISDSHLSSFLFSTRVRYIKKIIDIRVFQWMQNNRNTELRTNEFLWQDTYPTLTTIRKECNMRFLENIIKMWNCFAINLLNLRHSYIFFYLSEA